MVRSPLTQRNPMRESWSDPPLAWLLAGKPTVGDLLSLCEENFDLLQRLAPGLRDSQGAQISRSVAGVDLHLEVESQSHYTTIARLTYFFPDAETGGETASGADPDVLVRVCHDARQVEVLQLRQTALPRHADYRPPALESKWRINLFFSKWLAYCLEQGYRFGPEGSGAVQGAGESLLAAYT